MAEAIVTDNTALHRFELIDNGIAAFADYRRQGEVLIIPHVETDPTRRGGGTAGRLMEGVAAHARDQGLKITPICSYAAAWFRRHPDQQDLLA